MKNKEIIVGRTKEYYFMYLPIKVGSTALLVERLLNTLLNYVEKLLSHIKTYTLSTKIKGI